MRSFFGLLTLFLFFVSQVASQCGPPQCYTGGCTDARVQVDFVFFVDDSGSMSDNIAGVRAGLYDFASSIANSVNAQYSIVTLGVAGSDPRLNLQLTDSLNDLYNHLHNIQANGGWESGLEALLASLDLTVSHKLGINYRQYAKKVFILLTDEDSDPSYYNENRFQSTTETDNLCKDNNLGGSYDKISSTNWNNQWQKEINTVANALIANQVSIYMMVNSNKKHKQSSWFSSVYDNCNAFAQYCDPNSAVQSSDYSNFNVQQTLTNLISNGYGACLQAQLMNAALTSRCFDVEDADDADLVANFYQAISKDLGYCDPCYSYNCNGDKCQAPVYDKCGCDGKISNPLVSYDCAGVCGGNHAYDQCNVCTLGGVLSSDCVQDCAGVYYNQQSQSPPHTTDKCGQCSPVANPLFCRQDCEMNWTITSQEAYDALGGCVVDCKGKAGGNAVLDDCGQCTAEGDTPEYPCVQDCDSNYYLEGKDDPEYVSDPVTTCGQCVPSGQTGDRDNCNQCTNTIGYNSSSCTQDCKSVWRLATDPDRAVLDVCNDCWDVDELDQFNSAMDDCGECGGHNDNLHVDTQNVTCCFEPQDCSMITGPNKTSCFECPAPPLPCVNPFHPFDPSFNVPADNCGHCAVYDNCTGINECTTNPNFLHLDDCNLCCTIELGDCNLMKDDCGVCFGFNSYLDFPCQVCNEPDNTDCYDCSGTPFGTKTYDCAGVCGGTATDCNTCGDGKVGDNEECDDGSDNGTGDSNCNADCTLKVGSSQAAIIGGVVGAIVALVLLAAVAFLAFKYIVSHGLLSKASSTVDMGASNSNPLYKSETQVHSNPLYQA